MSTAFDILSRNSDQIAFRYEQDLDVCIDHSEGPQLECLRVSQDDTEGPMLKTLTTPSELGSHLEDASDESIVDIFFINQSDSWSPVQITNELLSILMQHWNIMPEFLRTLSLFKDRIRAVEETFSGPVQIRETSTILETAYVYKYCENKKSFPTKADQWVIRQTGVYHRLDRITQKSSFIIISPNPSSSFVKRLKQHLQSPESRQILRKNSEMIHCSLLTAYMPNWQSYLAHYEDRLLKMANTAGAASIDEPLRVRHDSLKVVRDIEGCILPIEAIMNNNKRLISTFRALGVKNQVFCNFSPGPAVEKTQMQSIMHSLDTEAASYHNQACYLLKKAESVRGSIADTLNIKFQLTSQEQSESMWTLTKAAQHESVAIRVITLVTMFYLPFSFVATIMGMNLVVFDTKTRHLVVSSQFWLYFVVALPLTALTITLWRYIEWRNRKSEIWSGQTASSKKDPEKMV